MSNEFWGQLSVDEKIRRKQNAVFQWLSDKTQNGWNDQAPVWNFSKYLINENGQLTHFFGPAIDPESEAVKEAIKK